ncbi:MAG TPA: hypothetical protein QGH10_12445 [Armatimonadota bacterium]|nr:hypothetical protein [Armatimonadota bacterium]
MTDRQMAELEADAERSRMTRWLRWTLSLATGLTLVGGFQFVRLGLLRWRRPFDGTEWQRLASAVTHATVHSGWALALGLLLWRLLDEAPKRRWLAVLAGVLLKALAAIVLLRTWENLSTGMPRVMLPYTYVLLAGSGLVLALPSGNERWVLHVAALTAIGIAAMPIAYMASSSPGQMIAVYGWRAVGGWLFWRTMAPAGACLAVVVAIYTAPQRPATKSEPT